MTAPETPASTLRALMVPGDPVVLPNAWDVASARVLEKAGFPALATTSGGVAKALGFADGEQAPFDEMVAAAGRIRAGVAVPVTADMESGYGRSPAELAAALTGAGLAGLNFEDTDHRAGGLRDAASQAERIAALRRACDETGTDLVINARVDVFLHPGGSDDEKLADGIERAKAYRDAGADSVFPIFLGDETGIARFVEETGAPVNVFLRPGCPPLARLAELGVARVTFGSGLMHHAMERLSEIAQALRSGDSSAFA